MCINIYYFNIKHMIEKIMSNQSISMIELLSFQLNKVHINICI